MLRQALNAVTKMHSRVATLKRLGTVDIYSPCRLTPSNYFRFLRGPEYTTVKGAEFIVPVDTLTGQFSQIITFEDVPDAGTFKIKIGAETTAAIAFNATASQIQTAVRLLPSYANTVVTGNFTLGFTILFVGIISAPTLAETTDSSLTKTTVPVGTEWIRTSEKWAELIRRGDRIIDGSKQWAVDEIIEMHDFGATVMAYRIRCD